MLHKCCVICLFIGLSNVLYTQTIQLDSTRLPIIRIYTNGQNIPDEPKITASMGISDQGPGLFNRPGDFPNVYNGFIGIEKRGSSSQYFYEKKAYSIELRKTNGDERSESLLGMPSESDWALISPLNDKTLLRDKMAYTLAGLTMDWAPRSQHVEVLLNDVYEGVYLLVEVVRRNNDRVNVPKLSPADTSGAALTGGYIMSFDKIAGSYPGGDWVLPYHPVGQPNYNTWVQMVYPKWSDLLPVQRKYIKNYIDDFDRFLFNWTPNTPGPPAYLKYIDVDSWVDYLLVNELCKNVDGYRLSAFFYKDRDTSGLNSGKIHMGPVWDFNISMGIGDYCQGESYKGWVKNFNKYCSQDQWLIHFWWDKLLQEGDFQVRVKERWKAMRQQAWSDQRIRFLTDSLAQTLEGARDRNFLRWPVIGKYVWPNGFIGANYADELQYMRLFLINRAQWMDENIEFIGPEPIRETPGMTGPVFYYPNPVAKDNLFLEYDLPAETVLQIYIYDTAGRFVIKSAVLPTGEPVLFQYLLPSTLGNGLYYLKFVDRGKEIQNGKLMILK